MLSSIVPSVVEAYKVKCASAKTSFVPFLTFKISTGYVGVLASLGVVVVVSPGLLPYSNRALFFSVTTAFLFTFA